MNDTPFAQAFAIEVASLAERSLMSRRRAGGNEEVRFRLLNLTPIGREVPLMAGYSGGNHTYGASVPLSQVSVVHEDARPGSVAVPATDSRMMASGGFRESQLGSVLRDPLATCFRVRTISLCVMTDLNLCWQNPLYVDSLSKMSTLDAVRPTR